MALSREDILGLRPRVEQVEIEGVGKFTVRGLSAKEREVHELAMVEVAPDGRTRVKRTQRNIRTSLVAKCLVDDAGNRLFSDKDMEALGEVDGAVINTLWDHARRLSGMSTEAEEEAEAAFEQAQDDGSFTE